MSTMDDKMETLTNQKYLALLSGIENIENRLKWSELGYIALNLIVFFPTIYFVSHVFEKIRMHPLDPIDLLFMLFCYVIGMAINSYWTTSSMRLQLKLKLRYFQARCLERKLNIEGEFFVTDEALFFDPAIGQVESPDGKEKVVYPREGALRMDGFVGAAKPRLFSLLIPSVLFVIYLASFLTVLSLVISL